MQIVFRNKSPLWVLTILLFFLFTSSQEAHMEWGFYSHRLINRMAVFTLPKQMLGFYKQNLSYIQSQSIAPDTRKHSSPIEAILHYIDLDTWSQYDASWLKKDIADIIILTGQIDIINDSLQTTEHYDAIEDQAIEPTHFLYDTIVQHLKRNYFDVLITHTLDIENVLLDGNSYHIKLTDQFSDHGILPYHLQYYQKRLEKAFIEGNADQILRLSSEIGHYIADAHVPLHTTMNYNGQLTGQDGIHAFWETRIPELFAEASYDFFIEEIEYIEDLESFFWNITLESHALVDDVLSIEKELRQTFPKDQQYCYQDRNHRSVRVPCPQFSKAYEVRMNGMVERRMQETIRAIGSVWYTSWANAGLPELPATSKDRNNEVEEDLLDKDVEYNHEFRKEKKNKSNE